MKIKNKIFIFFYLIISFNLIIKNLYAEIPLYKLNAIKISYTDNNKIISAEGQAYAVDQFGKEIFSDFIIYDKSKNIIKTKKNSKYRDKKGNKIDADSFFYDLNIKKIIATNNVKYEEINGNIFYFSEFEYFENLNKGFGRNVKALMADKSSFESEYLKIDNNSGVIVINSDQKKINFFEKIKTLFSKDNKYTTCKDNKNSQNIKEQCPDWSLSTFETRHDSKKKMVYHDHAIIKIRNIPVFYTPYFSHPDPSEKRKSGFLPVSTKNFTYLGRTLKSPYFWAIDKNSDLTFTPIFYNNENDIYLTEYRKQSNNSSIIIDTSYSSGYRDINKTSNDGTSLNRTNGSRSHFLLNFLASYEDIFFENNDVQLDIQRVSQKNYLEVNQINTNLVKQDIATLNNKFILSSYEKNKKFKISANIFENLKNDNPNTKYQYIFPLIEYDNFFEKFGNFFKSYNSVEYQNVGGDSNFSNQINILSSESKKKIFKEIGISNTIKTQIANINSYNDNILNSKENLNSDLFTTIAIENSLPLIKINKIENKEEIIIPKLFSKYSTGSMSNASNVNKILNYKDIYSLNRLDSKTNIETGGSIGYGIEYNLNKKNNNNQSIFQTNLSIGQILNEKTKIEMPNNSSLNNKSSDIVGAFKFNINENKKNNLEKKNEFEFSYNFNISNNINQIQKNDIKLSLANENHLLNASFYELNNIGSEHYLDLNYKKNIFNNINFGIGGRKNLNLDYTENNFIETTYDSDCLQVGIKLEKQFYADQDLRSSNNLIFFITLKPFGKPIAPDLSNFIQN